MAVMAATRILPHRTLIPSSLPLPLPRFNIQYPSSSSSSSSSSFSSQFRLSHSHRPSSMSATAINNNPIHQHNGCWSEFAARVSGEWDGHGADFTIHGNPIELPENVVPDAYREWEVKVFDWQTQCPTLAQPHHPSAIYKLIKLLPTVGCEADAATRHTVDHRTIGGQDNMVSAFAYHSTGSYTALWSTHKKGSGSGSPVLELEHSLIDPRDKESRVRIIQVVGVDKNQKLALKNITVYVEQWYGPFRNGEQLGGCAIRDSAFASTQALTSSQLSGLWQCSNSIARFQDSSRGILEEIVTVDGVEKLVRDKDEDEDCMVLLPKNLWSSMKETEDGEETWCKAGWLLEPGRAITSKCIFSRNTELKEIIISSETAVPGAGPMGV